MLLDGYCLWYMCDYTALHHIHCMKLFNTNFGVLIWKILHFCFSTYVTLSHKICAFRSIFVRWRSLVLSLNMTSVNERHVPLSQVISVCSILSRFSHIWMILTFMHNFDFNVRIMASYCDPDISGYICGYLLHPNSERRFKILQKNQNVLFCKL